jgi:hypothetical protein
VETLGTLPKAVSKESPSMFVFKTVAVLLHIVPETRISVQKCLPKYSKSAVVILVRISLAIATLEPDRLTRIKLAKRPPQTDTGKR